MRYTFESAEAQIDRLKKWKRWFAWHPIFIEDTMVWLEIVERAETPNDRFGGWSTHYRYIKEQP